MLTNHCTYQVEFERRIFMAIEDHNIQRRVYFAAVWFLEMVIYYVWNSLLCGYEKCTVRRRNRDRLGTLEIFTCYKNNKVGWYKEKWRGRKKERFKI